MERQDSLPPAGEPSGSLGAVWILVLLGLVAWQCWMTLTLFMPPTTAGPARLLDSQRITGAWLRLCNDDPLLSGRHPLHLYFGYLGARSIRERGSPCCYDPAFQIGYPKTPVFDSGSRPAELFLLAGGGQYRPAAYKIGVAACCVLAPLLLALAGWGLGLGRGGVCITVALGLLIGWGGHGAAALADGDVDLLLASLCGLASICLLVRVHQHPGLLGWLALFVTTCAGWYAHPLLLLLTLPLGLIYYLSVGARHGLAWHAALWGNLIATLAVNSFWLVDWARSWWIRLPVQLGAAPLPHRTFRTVWESPAWGAPADRGLAVLLLLLGASGSIVLNQCRHRPAARMLGLGSLAFLALAIGGVISPPLGRLGASELLLPALWFAVPATAFLLGWLGEALPRWSGGTGRAFLIGTLLTLMAGFLARPLLFAWAPRCIAAEPFLIGLGPERTELVDTLCRTTTTGARILWEDRTPALPAPRWSVLLPILSDRAFVGGLDPTASIEHAYPLFLDQSLAGRPIGEWSDLDLGDFCRRYNIGWVVCWSPGARQRLHAWAPARPLGIVHDGAEGELFAVGAHSFVLRGQARWLSADPQRITLADVVPEDGQVVLSLHYQAGMRVMPERVQIERAPDPFDPIPFIRLRVPGPVARVTLMWEPR